MPQGDTPALRPPQRADLPLWLALLLKRQRRADIVPPPWLSQEALENILQAEMADDARLTPTAPLPHPSSSSTRTSTSSAPPFQHHSTASGPASCLPYHWLSLSTLLLSPGTHTDHPDAEAARRLVRDLREVRAAKVRASVDVLEGAGGVRMDGIGALELGESRLFLTEVVNGLRKIGAAREGGWKDGGEADADGEDEDMQ